MSCSAFLGLRITAQMSLAARFTAGTTLPRILGMARTMPISAATTAITQRLVLSEELLLVSTAVAVIAAAIRKRIIWIAPPTPVLSTIALPPEATGTSCLCR